MTHRLPRINLAGTLAAIVLTTFFFLYLNLESIHADAGAATFASSVLSRFARPHNLALAAFGLVVGSIACSLLYTHRARCLQLLYRYRWLIAAGVVALCTLLCISGSSIGWWYDGTGGDGTILGQARGCRSDEFLVNTPMAFAQQFNDGGAWPYFGETFRGTVSDMFIVYGQPVADLAVVFRPFHWGYLLFGAERGLAFFWSARVVLLFMCTFEAGMLLVRNRKPFAFCLALLVTFAPVLCWWFDVNGYVEMIVSCEAMLLIVAAYLHASSYRTRFILGFPFVICAGCFVLTFYPALQVPMAYLFFVLAGVLIASHRKHGSYSWKDPLIIGCFFLLFCAGMAYVLTKSWDTVQTVLNTAYPGHRADCGGGAAALLAQYPMDALTPLRSFSDSLRIDAYASVYDFFPLGMLLALWVLVRERTRDTVLVALLAVSAFVGWYCFIGFPEPLAKLTLMSLSTGGLYSKAFIVFGLVNLLLLFRSLSLLQAQPSRRAATALAAVLALALTAACAFTHTWFFSIPVFAACLLALAGGFFVLLRRSSGMMCAYLTALALFMGVMVNPVQVGASPLLDNQTRQAVAAVNAENPASRWAVTGKDSSAFADLAATSGAAVINTCNVYPNLELWQKFDPGSAFDSLYNRYAHISIEITHEDSHFGDAGFDSFSLYLNPNDTDLLDVDYLLTTQDLAGFSTDEVLFERIAEVGDHAIYQVVQR